MIKREIYLKRIRPFYDSSLIKVLVGIRRCGKSVLLTQIVEELQKNGVASDHILSINFELLDFYDLREKMVLHAFIKNKIIDKQKYYVFFDEIQNVVGFEEVLNSLRADDQTNVSLFITGSNSRLLSGEIATLLSGRYLLFTIHPFIYEEIVALKEQQDETVNEETFLDYLKWGGMPQRFELKSENEIRTYFQGLFDSIVIRDILSKAKSTDLGVLNRILAFMLDNSGNIFSANSISTYFKSEKTPVNTQTVYTYVDRIMDSFIMSKTGRYDISGKKLIQMREKYYIADLGIRRAAKLSLNPDYGKALETLFYNELISRDFRVYTGDAGTQEIDFIAIRNEKKYYFQITYLLSEPATIEREFGAYRQVKDNYPKYVISLDKVDFSQDGIIHLNAEALLKDFDSFIR
jgi:predicted AAA+ superfamily ATPase